MTRSLRNLGIAALGVAVLLGGLWAITRGQVAAGETDGLTGRSGPELPEPELAPDLIGIEGPAELQREAVTESSDGEHGGEESGDVVELASVSGALFLPSAFDPTEPTKVFGWPIGDDDRTPVEIEIAASAREWTFKELPMGSWIFTARAVAEDHCAWGKSKEVQVSGGDDRDGVEVHMKEFGVRGVVSDSNGAALPGVEVHYSLDFSDQTVGEIGDWTQRRDLDLTSSSADPWRVALGGREAVFVSSFLGTDNPAEIKLSFNGLPGTVAEAPLPRMPPIEMQALDLGALDIQSEVNKLVADAALLEALTRQVEFEVPVTPMGSPNLNDPGFTGRLTEGLIPGWNFTVNTGAEVLEEPSIPSSGAVTTDASGRFWIALPGPGEVTMTVRSTRIQQGDTDPGFLGSTTSVDLTDDAPIGDAILSLERAAAITGRLVRGDGNLEGISVFLRALEGGGTDTSNTDANGHFSFSGRKPGKYIFYARSGGSSGQDYCTDAALQLTAGSIYQLDDVLTASSSLTGVVTDNDGEPVPDVSVVAFGADNRSLKRSGRTDQWGAFTISGMYAVEYTLEVAGKKAAEGMRFRVPPGGGTANAGTLTVDVGPAKNW